MKCNWERLGLRHHLGLLCVAFRAGCAALWLCNHQIHFLRSQRVITGQGFVVLASFRCRHYQQSWFCCVFGWGEGRWCGNVWIPSRVSLGRGTGSVTSEQVVNHRAECQVLSLMSDQWLFTLFNIFLMLKPISSHSHLSYWYKTVF